MKLEKIAIFGAGGFGREIKMLIDQINEIHPRFEIVGFYDDGYPIADLINGLPVLGGINELNQKTDPLGIVFSIGNPKTKQRILSKFSNPKVYFPTLIHPTAIIGSDDVTIGQGCIICAGVIITVNIHIDDHVILNLNCTIGHDSAIGKYASLMPGVNVSGEVTISEGVYVGTGAKIINKLIIGSYSIIGAGAVVSKSIPECCTAVGIPAKPIKFHPSSTIDS